MAKPVTPVTPVTPVATVESDKAKLLATTALPSQEEIDRQTEAFLAAKKQAFADAMAALGLSATTRKEKSSEPVDPRQSGLKAAATYKARIEAEQKAAFLAGKPIPLSAADKAVLTRKAKLAAWEAKNKG
jgi:hypothetical protein